MSVGKQNWPKYVKVYGKHYDSIYLVMDATQYTELAMKVAEQWYRDGEFGERDWYFEGTYDEFFFEKMGFNELWYKANIEPMSDDCNEHIKAIKMAAAKMPNRYKEEQQALRDLTVLENYFDKKTGKFSAVHDILRNVPWRNTYRFSPDVFDNF